MPAGAARGLSLYANPSPEARVARGSRGVALDAGGAASPEYTALQARGTRLGILLGVVVVVIIGLMVLKPTL